jgi:hypothetical protein
MTRFRQRIAVQEREGGFGGIIGTPGAFHQYFHGLSFMKILSQYFAEFDGMLFSFRITSLRILKGTKGSTQRPRYHARRRSLPGGKLFLQAQQRNKRNQMIDSFHAHLL